MTANETRYWVRSFSSPVPATITPPVTPDEMRAEYDIRGGQRGKHVWRYRGCLLREYLSALFR